MGCQDQRSRCADSVVGPGDQGHVTLEPVVVISDRWNCSHNSVHASATRVANSSSIDLHAPTKLLVLVADEFDHLIVGRDLLIDANGKWLRVRL